MCRKNNSYICFPSVNRALQGVEKALPLLLLVSGLSFAASPVTNLTLDEAAQLLTKKKWAEAALAYKTLLIGEPTEMAVLQGLSRALAQSRRREEALQVLIQAVPRLRGRSRAAIIQRIVVISRTFFSNENFQSYQDALNLLSSRKFGAAAEKFQKLLETEPDNVEVLIRLGQALVQTADYDSAAERLRTAKRLNPYEPEVSLWLGRALHYRGELAEAIVELKTAQEKLPDSEISAIWHSEALFSMGQRNLALNVLQEDVRQRPMHVSSLLGLARMRIQATGVDQPAYNWSARKDLQLALSRLDQYTSPNSPWSEGELGLDLRPSAEQLRAEIQRLTQDAEVRALKLGQPKAIPSPPVPSQQ